MPTAVRLPRAGSETPNKHLPDQPGGALDGYHWDAWEKVEEELDGRIGADSAEPLAPCGFERVDPSRVGVGRTNVLSPQRMSAATRWRQLIFRRCRVCRIAGLTAYRHGAPSMRARLGLGAQPLSRELAPIRRLRFSFALATYIVRETTHALVSKHAGSFRNNRSTSYSAATTSPAQPSRTASNRPCATSRNSSSLESSPLGTAPAGAPPPPSSTRSARPAALRASSAHATCSTPRRSASQRPPNLGRHRSSWDCPTVCVRGCDLGVRG